MKAIFILFLTVCSVSFGGYFGGSGAGGDFLADGSVPMTGDLDVGLNNIVNANSVEWQGGGHGPMTLSVTAASTYDFVNGQVGALTRYRFFTQANDLSDDLYVNIHANSSRIFFLGYDASESEYHLSTSGTAFPIVLGHGVPASNALRVETDSSISIGAGDLRVTGGAIASGEQLTALTADDQSVTANRTMMRVTSDDVTSTNRTMDLQNGTRDGQILIIVSDTPTNAWELQDVGNKCLNALFTSSDNSTISLIWNSTTVCWHETSRSAN